MRPNEGWRVAFLAGPALAFVILIVRRNLPESPRWLITHGREPEAEEAMRRIEEAAIRDGQHLEPVPESAAITILPEARYGYLTLLRVAFRQYPQRAVLGATLMMIAGTYLLSGSMLAASAWLFDAGVLHAAGQTFIWIVVFFFAIAQAMPSGLG